jgi:tetratricopeptide (TPR) repeat protein
MELARGLHELSRWAGVAVLAWSLGGATVLADDEVQPEPSAPGELSEPNEATPAADELQERAAAGAPRAAEPEAEPGGDAIEASDAKQGPPAEPTRAREPAPAAAEVVEHEPASFKEIQPGRSTADDLAAAWGQPLDVKEHAGGVRQRYRIEPFELVAVTLREGQVRSIVVRLGQPTPAADLARQLQLEELAPAGVFDAHGKRVGQAFPERGVLFSFGGPGGQPHVTEIVLEEIDPQAFALRAEQRLASHTGQSLRDVRYALRRAPRDAGLRALEARVLLEVGDLTAARRAIDEALRLAPGELAHRLILARVMARLGDFATAARENEEVSEAAGPEAPLVRAAALAQWGDCLSQGGERDYAQAIAHHQAAIRLAEPLAVDEHPQVRRAAKTLLLDAHLGVAQDIAWGRWQQKQRVVPKWLDRAREIGQNLVEQEGADRETLLKLQRGALVALAGFKSPPRPSDWIEALETAGKPLVDEAQDMARKQRLAWTVGLALIDAAEIEYEQRKVGPALQHGQQAIDYLVLGESHGRQSAGRDFLVGRLHYRLGVIQAVDRQDHQQAVAWYDKAVPLLESPVPPLALADPGKHGETFVSMAVSYWETGGREEALRLTEQGANLMELAVEQRLLERAALAVPYSNLASMHDQLGDAEQARKFAEMAARLGDTQQK